MIRRALLFLSVSLGQLAAPAPTDVRVGVFGLFHPRALTLVAAAEGLSLRGDRDRDGCVLRARDAAAIVLVDGALRVTCAGRTFTTPAVQAAGLAGSDAALELRVPERIARHYRGRLAVTIVNGELLPVVAMDLETAVASVVGAEQIDATSIEALKAQAVAARSFIVASRHRHRGFDVCDTTHCQFLREPPGDERPAAQAARETSGLVLTYRGSPIAAFYSASCGGRTRTLAEAGLDAGDGYPYFGVACVSATGRHAGGERSGHGIGLCQEGAAAMAVEAHASFDEILRHYYPETTLQALSWRMH